MKAERPSRTAQFVSLGRAVADAGLSHFQDCHDPTARIFLRDKGTKRHAKTERTLQEGKRTGSVEMARVMAALIALRTSTIDVAVREAIAACASQLVSLGAAY